MDSENCKELFYGSFIFQLKAMTTRFFHLRSMNEVGKVARNTHEMNINSISPNHLAIIANASSHLSSMDSKACTCLLKGVQNNSRDYVRSSIATMEGISGKSDFRCRKKGYSEII